MKRKTIIVQISRGVSPAVAIAATVAKAAALGADYHLITGKTAPEAKQEAARIAYDSGRHLILCEDDFIAEDETWERMMTDKGVVLATTALMRNGQLNALYHGPRLVLSGTVMLGVPFEVLDKMGAPWFEARNLEFDTEGEGCWVDHGLNADGMHSDTYFFYQCWELGIAPVVCGFVTHLIHSFNNAWAPLNNPHDIKPLGMMGCSKLSNKKQEKK